MRHIRPAITEDMAKSIACALVCSRLDYANSFLLGVSSKNVTRLQRAQNAAARVVLSSGAPGGDQQTLLAYLNSYIGCPLSGASSSRSPALPTKPYLYTQPAYLYSSLKHYTPSCVRLTLNCSPCPHMFRFSQLRFCATTIWNSLPLAIRSSGSTYSFRRQLKTSFYNLAFRPF